MDELDALLTRARRVVRAGELAAAGVSPARLVGAVRRQEWFRLYHGIYAVPPFEEAWDVVVVRGAARYAGPDAAVTHLTRLSLAGVWVPAGEPSHVAVQRPRSVRSGPGIVIHEVVRLDRVDLLDGIPVVPVAVALCASWVTGGGLGDRRALVCDVIGRGLSTAVDVRSVAHRTLRRRAELLETCAVVELGCHSPREIEYLLDVERAHGLPAGRRQVTIRGRGFSHRVDVLYEAARIVVEIDGRYHEDPAQRAADARRDADLRSLGYRVLRVTGDDLRRPASVAARVRAMMTAAA